MTTTHLTRLRASTLRFSGETALFAADYFVMKERFGSDTEDGPTFKAAVISLEQVAVAVADNMDAAQVASNFALNYIEAHRTVAGRRADEWDHAPVLDRLVASVDAIAGQKVSK